MKRDCPRCFSALRHEIIRKGIWKVEIDRCGSCSGIFLDKGELMTLTGNRPLHHLTTKHLGIDSDSELLCPSCGSLMDDEHAEGVEIDVCLQCNGVWLSNDARADYLSASSIRLCQGKCLNRTCTCQSQPSRYLSV